MFRMLNWLFHAFYSYPLLKIPVYTQSLTFHLAHQHAVTNNSHVIFSDISRLDSEALVNTAYSISTKSLTVMRSSSVSDLLNPRIQSIQHPVQLDWENVEVTGPDVEKRQNLLLLANMTHNSYFEPEESEWYNLGPDWNTSFPFGWEPDADGFRGHIFVSSDNSTVVITIKGTSAGWIVGSGGPTQKKDKLNDNLLFSCCCARVGPTWSTVCDCYKGSYKCDQSCVEQSVIDESLYYSIGTNLYYNVTYMYPEANIWLIGHSLGGSLASLVGATFGIPVVAFEAPAERLASRRLHLPSPPSTHHVTHVYHTGDPIPMGVCTGISSICAIGGFALETRCHLGQVIRYETVEKHGWSVTPRKHPIDFVIENVLNEDWDPANGREVPEPRAAIEVEGDGGECIDCFQWEYGDFSHSSASNESCRSSSDSLTLKKW